MNTERLVIDPQHPDPALIERAASLLRNGELVAFPTETVYGLGANALDTHAVQAIFAAKGRPANNPLIVHVAGLASAKQVAKDWNENAEKLATRFWPGPLTLVLPKAECIPDIVTAGGPTVAVRVPSHPIALALITAANVPIAAPSANRSNRLSPTLAQHVFKDFNGRIRLIVDGGPTSGGLESTVIDVTTSPPTVLRPGLLGADHLRAVVGDLLFKSLNADAKPQRSPGMMRRHYAPHTPLVCCQNSAALVAGLADKGRRVGWVCFEGETSGRENVFCVVMPKDAQEYAQRLYAALHELDTKKLDQIVVERPPATEEWRAVRDRLQRAATMYKGDDVGRFA